MKVKSWLEELPENYNVNHVTELKKLTAMNDRIMQFGLTISKEDALLLLDEQKCSLKEQQRVEFGEGILPKLILAFCDSSYIYQQNFVEVMGRLQNIFYEYKNETGDKLSDDELIEVMSQAFEGACQGSLDYLEETILNGYVRELQDE